MIIITFLHGCFTFHFIERFILPQTVDLVIAFEWVVDARLVPTIKLTFFITWSFGKQMYDIWAMSCKNKSKGLYWQAFIVWHQLKIVHLLSSQIIFDGRFSTKWCWCQPSLLLQWQWQRSWRPLLAWHGSFWKYRNFPIRGTLHNSSQLPEVLQNENRTLCSFQGRYGHFSD